MKIQKIKISKSGRKEEKNAIKLLAWTFLLCLVGFLFLLNMNLSRADTTGLNSDASEQSGQQVKGVTSCEQVQSIGNLISSVKLDREWYLLGKEIDASKQVLHYDVQINKSLIQFINNDDFVLTYDIVNTDKSGELIKAVNSEDRYQGQIYIGDLDAGIYSIQSHIDFECGSWNSALIDFNLSYPVYVAWTIDWEGIDIKDQYLDDIDKISQKHDIPLTHFFNPRYYTNPNLSDRRAQYFTQWVIRRRDKNGHAIALHMHMFPDMVKAAGVQPKSGPAWGSSVEEGYDVLTSAYSYDEMIKMFEWSKDQFKKNGLGTPTMYRAGGWYADMDVLKAAEDTGFVLDSSGRTAYSFGTNRSNGHWDLKETTQPYQINIDDQNSAVSPNMSLWEFPNNGADSFAFSKDQMIKRFYFNYPGAKNYSVVKQKVLVTYLSHPEWFHIDKSKMQSLFIEVDKYSYESDKGPVKYITLKDAYKAWAM